MKFSRSLIYFAVAAVVLSLVGVQDADAARRNSLAGNLLIEDRDDIFLWPQLAVNHTNLVGFDYGMGAQAGNGYLVWGSDTSAFGVAVHRGDLFDQQLFPYETGIDAPSGPLAGTGLTATAGTVFDVFAGFDLGGGLACARLAIGRGSDTTTPADPDADGTSNTSTFVLLQGGYSMKGPLVLDTALNLSFATGSNEAGDDVNLDATEFGLGLKARGYTDMGQDFELGFLGDIVFNSQSVDTGADNTVSSSETNFAIQGGAGPVWEVGPEEDDTVIAGYAVLGYQMESSDPNTDEDDDAGSSSDIILPGFNVAADIELLDWLYFRSGAQYLWAIESSSDEVPDQDNDSEASTSGTGGFAWNAGIGIEVGNFRFDGSFQHGFLTNGPNFIGGGNGFLSMASAEYAW